MRYYQKLLLELRDISERVPAGQQLPLPSLLKSEMVFERRVAYVEMGLDHGQDNAVILLHGFGGCFMDWPRVMVPISRTHKVFAIDLPGWGFSESAPEQKGMEYHIEVVREFIRMKGLSRVTLIGISYGAALAWSIAATKAPEVARLMLLNPMPPYPKKYMKSWLYRLIFIVNQNWHVARWAHILLTRQQYKWVLVENLKNRRLLDNFYLRIGFLLIKQPHVAYTLHVFARLATKIPWHIWIGKLEKINIPTRILQGQNDRIFGMKSARYLQSLIPDSELIEVPDCGHGMMFDNYKAVILEFQKFCPILMHKVSSDT